jgi:TolA-binding protein
VEPVVAAPVAPPEPAARPRARIAPAPIASRPPPVDEPTAAADTAPPQPDTAPPQPDTAPTSAPPPTQQAPAPSLADEVTALDTARAALARGDTARALADLDAYERRFPSGVLAPEADVVRIEALFASGDISAARGRAGRFLASHSNSPLAARVRELVLRAR